MKKLLLSIFALVALNSQAQTPSFESVQKFDCDDALKIVHSKTDQAGNVYIGGYYIGTADFDPSTASNNQTAANYNSFIQKQTSTGTILWTKFGTDINGMINYFDVDPSGNVYLLGYFAAVYDADFGSGTFNLTSNGNIDYFVTKLNNQGEFVWATSGGGTNVDMSQKITVNSDGEAYLAILETSDVLFFGSTYSKDLKIVKLNSSGTQVWSSKFGGNTGGDFDFVNLELDHQNNPITSGRLRGARNFSLTNIENYLGSFSNSTWDEFLVKLVNATGAVSWANVIEGVSNSLVSKKLAVDNQGNSYTFGRLGNGEVDFDVSANVANSVGLSASHGFLHKTTSSGQHAWTRTFYGDFGFIDTDNQGNIYILNDFTRNLSKYDNSGNNLWDFPYAGTDAVIFEASSFNIDNLGTIYITGNGQASSSNHDTLSFNGANLNGQIIFTNTTNNSSEAFLTKFSQCLLSNAITVNGTTISATQSGASYQWINCANNTPISGANSQTFTATANGSYAVVISAGSCVDTSTCTTFNTIGIDENVKATFAIFPNPANENVTISNIEVGSTISLIDVTGKIVATQKTNSTTVNLQTVDFNTGVYFVRVLNANGKTAVQKLIIE